MTNKPSAKKVKKLRVGFYTSSDATRKSGVSMAMEAFERLYNECTSNNCNHKILDSYDKKLKITFLEKNVEANFYYGFMTVTRNSAHLAYIADDATWSEEKIPLSSTKKLAERSYFIYYYKSDLLILSQNHLGPKSSDLSYALFKSLEGAFPVTFAAIWKEESIKELFETGTILKTCELTIAAPRNFNRSEYQLQGRLSSQIADMLAGSGTSHLDLVLRGKSPTVDSKFEWLSDDVKLSIKELLERCTGDNKGIEIQKANVIRKGNNRKTSLVDQVLIYTKSVHLQHDGYPKDTDVKTALIQSKLENKKYLAQYDITKDQDT